MPQLEGDFRRQVLGPEVMEAVAAAFRGVATVVPEPPPPPYQLCLQIDVGLLSRLSGPQQDGWSRSLASVRLLSAGHPLRLVFRALEAGTLTPGPPLVCCNTPGQVYVIKPGSESVTLVFPLRFRSRQDCAIGVACLQEFVEARRGPSLGRAPTCSYSPRDPPGELAGVDLSSLLGQGWGAAAPGAAPGSVSGSGPGSVPGFGLSGGYLSLSLTRRHVAGPQMEGVVWSLATLHQFVAYHVKATKAMMHSRMRRRVAAMVDLLEAGRVQGGQAAAAAAAAAAGDS